MKTHFKYYLILLFVLTVSYTFSQSTVFLEDETALRAIGTKVEVLEDEASNLSIETILSERLQTQFRTNTQDYVNFSSTASTYWLKFKVQKRTAEPFYLNIGSAYIDAISLYEFDTNMKRLSTRHTGDDRPFLSREVETGSYLFRLNLEPEETRVYYLSVKSDQPLFFPICVGTLPNFMAYMHDLDFLQGIYFGFMLLIFLYNLFLYFSTKETIYVYYIMYVFSITWFMASVFGYFFEYLWPNVPFINQLVVVSSGLTMITATLFTQKFLETKRTEPLMHKGAFVFLAIGIGVCLMVALGLKIEGLKLAQAGLLLMALYFVILGIRFKLKGYRPATYYLIAWGALIVGICFAILESLDIAPVMSYLNAMQIGSALEVLLLSFALGDRIKMYKQQKEDAQAQALVIAKENEILIKGQNEILENKVKKRTAEVALQNEELLAINKEKDVLVHIVAHDLRTPLSQIKGLLQLLDMTDLEEVEERQGYLQEIDNSTDRLSEMINRILSIHTLEHKDIKLKMAVINLDTVVKSVVESFQFMASEKAIAIHFETETQPHFAEIDKDYFIQVIENLISNAVKFSERHKTIVVSLVSQGSNVRIIVADQGPGISANDQKKLFGRYQKLTAQPTGGEASTGLGLSIVKKYVEAMGGTIHCESELGKGSRFIVVFKATLPVT